MSAISVVIPLYNKEKYIQRTLKSVLSQTVRPEEIIVVDDGSTDSGPSIVENMSAKDSRIRLIRQSNSGVSAARNRGIKEARYELVALLDSDDTWKPDFLETILRLRQKYPEAGAYATAYETSEKPGEARPVEYKDIPPAPWEGIIPHFFKSMLGQPPVWSSAVAIPKYVFETAGYFKVGEVIAEDVDMWCRIALKYPIAFSTKICAIYHLDAENRAYVKGKKNKKATGYLETLHNALKSDSVLPEVKTDIMKLIETVELGYATSLIFAGEPGEARKSMNAYNFRYYRKQKHLWYLLSFFPAKSINFMMDVKKRLK